MESKSEKCKTEAMCDGPYCGKCGKDLAGLTCIYFPGRSYYCLSHAPSIEERQPDEVLSGGLHSELRNLISKWRKKVAANLLPTDRIIGIEICADQLEAVLGRNPAQSIQAERDMLLGKYTESRNSEIPLVCAFCGKHVPMAFQQCQPCKERTEQQLAEARAQGDKQPDHVCGLAGYGAPGDVCPACEWSRKRAGQCL